MNRDILAARAVTARRSIDVDLEAISVEFGIQPVDPAMRNHDPILQGMFTLEYIARVAKALRQGAMYTVEELRGTLAGLQEQNDRTTIKLAQLVEQIVEAKARVGELEAENESLTQQVEDLTAPKEAEKSPKSKGRRGLK